MRNKLHICRVISVWNNYYLINNTFGHERSKSAFFPGLKSGHREIQSFTIISIRTLFAMIEYDKMVFHSDI